MKALLTGVSKMRVNVSRLSDCLALVVFVLVVTIVPVAADELDAKKLTKVGVVLGLTGYASEHGDAIRKGIELAVADLRQRRELLLEPEFLDDQTESVRTVSVVKDLIARGVEYVIGPTWSFQIDAAAPVIKDSNVIAIAPAGCSEIGGGPSEGLFFLSPPRRAAIPEIVSFLKGKRFGSAFLLTANGDWGYAHEKIYKEALQQSGIKIVGTESFDYAMEAGATTALMLKVRKASPDLIMTTATAADIYNFLRAREILKISAAFFGTDTNWELVPRALMKRSDLRDIYGVRTPSNPTFEDVYRKAHGAAPAQYAAEGYDAVMVMNELAKNHGKSRAEKIQFLQKELDLQGMSGRIRFNQDGDIRDPKFEVLAVQ